MTELGARLGLDVHRDQWPATPVLKSYEAAGFAWVQVHTPPPPMLADRERRRRHARSLSAALSPSGLRLLLHAGDLSAGCSEHDRAFDGLMDYAAEAGAELVVLHALRDPAHADAEERALARHVRRAADLGIALAVENLAPAWPGEDLRPCDDPRAVRDLVRRIGSPGLGMALDVGHAHLAASRRGACTADAVRAVLDDRVLVVHLHDNLGARRHDLGAPGVDPLKLDLHLPPGAGCLPWDRLGPLLRAHPAPLVLEVERSRAVTPASVATVTSALLAAPVVAR